jgi:pimeloyl-ACP methyl ester carboxylesterase
MRRRQFLFAAAALALSAPQVGAFPQETVMNEKTIQTRTLDMGIFDEGTGPLVLLCHGFPETKQAWRHQIAALAKAGYRAVAPDMRGYGKTDVPAHVDQYTVYHGVGDMVALLDALGEEKAVIVGHDWGATIAWQAALLRPDRFRAVAALSVPMMGQPPVPPTKIFPQTDAALFYALYFQEPGVAEAEFEADPRRTLRKLLFAASGEAGPRKPGDGTPNAFGMVNRSTGLLAGLPDPAALPEWLPAADFDRLVDAFRTSGFKGGLNYYRNLDRNWELQQAMAGAKIAIPALFLIGERDTGLSIPGMDQIIAAMPSLVPDLRGSHILPGAGHWLPQERPSEVSAMITEFLGRIGND